MSALAGYLRTLRQYLATPHGRHDARDDAALQDWRKVAPNADINHPSPEHFDPIFLARGAAEGEAVTRLHASWDFGSLSMNSYAFGL